MSGSYLICSDCYASCPTRRIGGRLIALCNSCQHWFAPDTAFKASRPFELLNSECHSTDPTERRFSQVEVG
jgi:hypothetical protein